MPEPFAIPELARSLRAFGAAADDAGLAAHAAIFGPLLDARARAAASDLHEALAAFRGEALAARISARVDEAARARIDDPPAARARSARARELLEPLRGALRGLDLLAPAAASGDWTAWIDELRRAFTAADASCRAFTRLLREPGVPPEPRRRWLPRLRGAG